MAKYIILDGELVEVCHVAMPRRFPAIIRDAMPALVHPADGKLYDSKSAFRRVTKEHGMIELGNDVPMSRPEYVPVGVAEDVREAIEKLEQGYRPEPAEHAGELDGVRIETRILE
jgi:hypothetical protein